MDCGQLFDLLFEGGVQGLVGAGRPLMILQNIQAAIVALGYCVGEMLN